MNVPVFALDAIESRVDIRAAVGRVLTSGRYILGPEVERFEGAFADYCGTRYCLGVASGTDALEIALRALDVGPGDTVLTAANAGPYSSTAIRAAGANPLYVDVDEASLNMSPGGLRAALEAPGVAAVIVTHLYGRLADMASLVPMAAAAGVPLIEDCAQAHGAQTHGGPAHGAQAHGAHGATHDGRRAGAFATLGCFSFYPTKNLGGIGDGGAITTDDHELAERIRALRQYGWAAKYRTEHAGGRNSRLDELQAAVLADRLPHLDDWNDERRAIAARYDEALSGLPLTLPPAPDGGSVAHLYVVRSAARDDLRKHLSANGVGTDVHFPVADHLQPAYLTDAPQSLPVTEAACDSVVSLPCYPGLAQDAQATVIEALRTFPRWAGR